MQTITSGLHHVTAMSGHPQRNVDFYAGLLGMRLVKVTVNFDDVKSYHLYYGDGIGSPGSLITFFPWHGAQRGPAGSGQVGVTSYSVPFGSLDYWSTRLSDAGVHSQSIEREGVRSLAFTDHDGILIELTETMDKRAPWSEGVVPVDFAIRGLDRVDLFVKEGAPSAAFLESKLGFHVSSESEDRIRLKTGEGLSGQRVDLIPASSRPNGLTMVGTVHHVAFRTENAETQKQLLKNLLQERVRATPVQDRKYFESIYFREPGHVLFEVATDGPGFAIDEPIDLLGTNLMLPDWAEPHREQMKPDMLEFTTPTGASFP
jgi:glyoxalase family protein